MITKKQFDVLDYLAEMSDGNNSQRKIATALGFSVGTTNKIFAELNSLGYVEGTNITEKGLEALEPYRVKRAIIIAAGFGSRLVPITLNTPKPLIRVKGKKIIETTLDALKEKGIDEVYIVRGYLAEQFDELLYKYPNIKFIENKKYNESNNISSIMQAREYLSSTYIIEADLVVYNPNIITKYQYSSNYLTVPVEETDDWCLYTTNNVVTKVAIGGKNCYKMAGISYWTKEDAAKLAEDTEVVFNSLGGKERYWDEVPLTYCKNNYKLSVRTCNAEDIIEIDTFNELKAIDRTYDV